MLKTLLFLASIVITYLSLNPTIEMLVSRVEESFFSKNSDVDLAQGLGIAVAFYALFFFLFYFIFFLVIGILTFNKKYRGTKQSWNISRFAKRTGWGTDILKIICAVVTIFFLYKIITNPFYTPQGKGIVITNILFCSFWVFQVIMERSSKTV